MKRFSKRSITSSLVAMLLAAVVLSPTNAVAKTLVTGGPLTNLDPAGSQIHLLLSAFPASPAGSGLYILQCLNGVSAGNTKDFCDTGRQLWISNSRGASFAPTDPVVLSVTGSVAGTECGLNKCSIFIRFDHTNSGDRSEDQLIPISFGAGVSAPTKPKDSITASIGGKELSTSNPGTVAYRTPVTITATAKSGRVVSFGSSTPDCTVISGVLTALKGTGVCNITATTEDSADFQKTVANYPFQLTQGKQIIPFSTSAIKKGSTVKLSATTNFGEKINYKSATSKTCTVKGATVKALKKGACVISATAAGQTGLWAKTTAKKSIKIT